MQDLRGESERLNEVKGHLEIALLEKHFLRKYWKDVCAFILCMIHGV